MIVSQNAQVEDMETLKLKPVILVMLHVKHALDLAEANVSPV